ncbi:MAG TPA: pirin family protein [Gammaproteobacteria bacterium]|nr:pirin family protein [Gammaproteobacteria bacterium]
MNTTNTQTESTGIRSVKRVLSSIRTREGGGFIVHRPFPTNMLMDFDPFLLLDEMGPVDYAPGEAVGAPDHPHRGFETVTYVLEGKMQHKDSHGHAGSIGPGDVQWMTAGAGVVHSEMPEDGFRAAGGRMHGFQIWVNLPQRDKMMKPRYQELPNAGIPVAESSDGKVRVKIIAGESLGKSAAIDTRTPIAFLHISMQPGGELVQPLPANYNAFAFVIAGEGRFGSEAEAGTAHQMVIFASDGGAVKLSVPETAQAPLELLLLAGVPLNEPVVRYGPFVMNSEQEIHQAMRDYQSGRMGEITI